jgi:hypothetical protein
VYKSKAFDGRDYSEQVSDIFGQLQAYKGPWMPLCFLGSDSLLASTKQSGCSYMTWVEISFLRLESFGINKNVQTDWNLFGICTLNMLLKKRGAFAN